MRDGGCGFKICGDVVFSDLYSFGGLVFCVCCFFFLEVFIVSVFVSVKSVYVEGCYFGG